MRASFLVKGKPYIAVSIAISVRIFTECVWFTAFSLFDVREAIATAPLKTVDKVATSTINPMVRAIKKKIRNRNVLNKM